MAISEIPSCLKTCTLSSEYASWIPLMGGILIVVVMGLSILFLVSRMMGRREWEALARAEFYQTGIAALWLILIASAATMSCTSVCSITGDDSPFSTAISYINHLRSGLEENSISLIQKAKEIRLNAAIAVGILGTFISPFAGCDIIAENYETFAMILSPILGSLIVQQYALIFISATAFQLLLPLGVALRIIPFFREAGAFVIAIAFALYIVLPLTYVLAEKATSGVSFGSISSSSSLTNCVDPGDASEIFRAVGAVLPQAVFFPALSMIITIAAARTLTKVFKYDFQEVLG